LNAIQIASIIEDEIVFGVISERIREVKSSIGQLVDDPGLGRVTSCFG
jgi:hypothetical protein